MLIDSNILVYSINKASPKNAIAQQFLKENIGNIEIAHQNIFESLRVLTHPKFIHPMPVNAALKAINALAEGCTIISPDYKTHRIALALIEKYSLISDQIFDAYLVATALSNNIEKVATDNVKDLGKFTELTVINPFTSS